MNVRVIAMTILLGFAFTAIMVAPIRAASTWYVDGNLGTDDLFHGTGPGVAAFKTIGYAVGFAGVASGDTIIVAQATYTESITITKGLTLIGDPGDASPGPGLNAPILDGTTLGNGVFAVKIADGVSNVVFEGFEICNYGTSGNTNEDGVVVWNTGMAFQPTSNIHIQDNYIHHVGYDGILTGNGWGGPQGLHSSWVITRNIIKNFGAYAVDLENTKDSQITNNIISEGSNAYWIVVLALGCGTNTIDMSNVEVSGNQLVNHPDRGINIMAWANDAGSSATLRDVFVTGNTLTGSFNAIIAWKTGAGTTTLKAIDISSNTITVNNPKSANYIIDLGDVSGTNKLENNIITLTGSIGGGGTFFHGVNIGGSATGTWVISNNKIDGNNVGASSIGLRIRGSLPSTAVLLCTCDYITRFAMGVRADALASGTQVKIEQCNIYANSQYGVNNGAGAMINAENTWWGQPTGPKHSSNPGGYGDTVSDNVDFTPWLTYWACQPVGGEWSPINVFTMLERLTTLISIVGVLTASFIYVRRKTRQL